ncbi:MAG: phospho-N-acetylmuramoyl-pentapeptide-transferase, partial [Pseudomonadota bacterium]
MLLNLLFPLSDTFGPFNLFQYLTFRSGGALMTSLIIAFLIGPSLIGWLKDRQGAGQPIREDGPQGHLAKRGTPTMGGLMILIAIVASTILWSDWRNGYVWMALLVTAGFGIIGALDDYQKLSKRSSAGVPGRVKLICQLAISVTAAGWIMQLHPADHSGGLALPFIKDFLWQLGWFFIPLAAFVMVGASNAVNLTDGLDGLA